MKNFLLISLLLLTISSVQAQYFNRFKNEIVIEGNIEEIIETKRFKQGDSSVYIKSLSRYNDKGYIEYVEFLDGSNPEGIETINYSYTSDNKIDYIVTKLNGIEQIKRYNWINDSVCSNSETYQHKNLVASELFYYNEENRIDSVLDYSHSFVDHVFAINLLKKTSYKRKENGEVKQIIETEYAATYASNTPVKKEVTLPAYNYIHLYKDGEYRVSQPLITEYQDRIRKLDYYRNNIDKKETEDHVVVTYNANGHLESKAIDNKYTETSIRVKRRYVYAQN